jgi:hypothetical protein
MWHSIHVNRCSVNNECNALLIYLLRRGICAISPNHICIIPNNSSARNFVIWLGEGTEYTDYALDMMNSTNFRERLKDLTISQRWPFKEEIIVDVVFKQVITSNPPLPATSLNCNILYLRLNNSI